MDDDEPLQIPIIDPRVERDIPLAESVEEQESDVYVARHNSIMNALGAQVDGALAEADVSLYTLSKGLAFEVALCNPISGDLAIRGRPPGLMEWRKSIQHEAGVSNGDALHLLLKDSRAYNRLMGSHYMDLYVDDGAMRQQCQAWISRCGERLLTAGEWWKEAASLQILDGAIARADEAAQLYFSTLVSTFLLSQSIDSPQSRLLGRSMMSMLFPNCSRMIPQLSSTSYRI
ncbi:unnamed protein product [Peniophora sp. CBMAI 1063]|nr:unnamed protein product [Peniophora sp. CBMAI 1063]